MNRYPLWKYVLVVLVLALGALYTIPNFFGESPAVQVSSAKATLKLGPDAVGRVQQALDAGLLLSVTADSVIRLVPPLIITAAEADEIVSLLAPIVTRFLGQP